MVDTKHTYSDFEIERPLVTGTSFTEEGQLVVRTMVNGIEHVNPSVPSATDIVIGFSKLTTVSPAGTRVYTAQLAVPATATAGQYLVTIGHLLITAGIDPNGDVSVWDRSAAVPAWLTLIAPGAPAATQFSVSSAANGILRFNAAEAGHLIDVYAMVTMSATERDQMFQQRHVNNTTTLTQLGNVGIWSGTGEIYTDRYDPSCTNWDTGVLYTGPLGCITTDIALGGTVLTALMRVTKIPTVSDPTLGLGFKLP